MKICVTSFISKKMVEQYTAINESHKALHEIHIFLSELNPSPEILQEYFDAVNEWNQKFKSSVTHQMKACYLSLVFRDPEGNEKVVKVMQSARYYRSNDAQEVIQQSHNDADWFRQRNLSVIREKIEARAYGIREIPLKTEDLPNGKYFEFHIKVGRKNLSDSNPITSSEISELKNISRSFSQKFKIPVPLSYNENKNKFNQDGLGHQRFLNLRFREGRDISVEKVDLVKNAIDSETSFRVIKVIPEYVWFDTFPELDKGWIDYTNEELEKMFQS
jgi:hypothetical protein